MAKAISIHVSKGREVPVARVALKGAISVDNLASALKRVTRDKVILRAVGLKACSSCISGFDLDIHGFEEVVNVEVQG